MGMGFGHASFADVPMHIQVSDHALIDKLDLREVSGKLDALCLCHLARNGELHLAGKLERTVAGWLVALHVVMGGAGMVGLYATTACRWSRSTARCATGAAGAARAGADGTDGVGGAIRPRPARVSAGLTARQRRRLYRLPPMIQGDLSIPARQGALARLRARIAERGLAATVAKLWGDRIFRHSASVILEYRREWGGRSTYPSPRPGQSFVTVRGDAALPPLCPFLAPRARDFARMAQEGKVGMFVLEKGVAVGCAWLSLSDHRDRAAREFYRVPPGEAYHYCWLVAPEQRAGASMALCRYVMAVTAEIGITRQFGVVDRRNAASYRVQMHYGYRECGQLVRHFYILGTRWTRMSRYTGILGLAGTRARRG